ncbi:hypothetical protein [Actinosynnema mirum]|uniref:Uncharacterized protein n=1 Tax=Actinosynnema mirum (strain ATCC 29888 / DSM 43827 / JCM 3225 / NBRC 14064 / NCIMB 13271 / NRRL B-12336 / IMRU 3971 / 101) TaxID=446462 RepID=C6WF27_ACTMD|nr:hypothetical protein [Actinosynnema mirum]ACU34159.1 conserved hypothetical protein [Actinosynnema mirum DSM 43827]
MIIGVSGHQDLPASAQAHAEKRIRALLAEQAAPVTGVGSLAEGADQLFAQLVLAAGGSLHVVIPSRGYETTFAVEARCLYRELLARADTVTELDFPEPGEQAYYAAGHHVAECCDLLVAVWDGQPARGLGGTADAVAHARELGRDVMIVWPEGVRRT